MAGTRTIVASFGVGLVLAIVLVGVALQLGYSVGPGAYSFLGMAWRYGGLVVVAAIPVSLALRYRLVSPVVALILTTWYVLWEELTPPGPTFRDLAELERLAEPTGIVVVENGLYIVQYMVNASVWTVGFLFLGVVEYAVRTGWANQLSVEPPDRWLATPESRRPAAGIAAVAALLHAIVMVWYAERVGVSVSGGSDLVLYAVSAIGMFVLAAVPLYLLLRHELVGPGALLALLVLLNVRATFSASADDPHAVYFGGWFVFLAVLLVVAAIEYGLRRVDVYRRIASRT